MKKILVLLGILCLLVFALSCGGTKAPESNTEESPSAVGGSSSATEGAGGAAEESGGQTQSPSEEQPTGAPAE